MFDTLANMVPRDKDFPERTWHLEVLRRVLHGKLYDVLDRDFHEETMDNGEYIPLRKRKPSVRFNLCNMVVRDSTGLLFGEGYFPQVDMTDADQRQRMLEIIKETKLSQVMCEAAFRGSIGSVAVFMRILKGRIFFSVLDTCYLTPEWDPEEPDALLRVTEKYKLTGADLAAAGYPIPKEKLTAVYWVMRVWDAEDELRYRPWLVEDKDAIPVVDPERSTKHGLGFVPIEWIRNLLGGHGVDGACTFRLAIESMIEIDYQLSQAGRGLKYSSDPLLLLKEPAVSDGNVVRSSSNAIVVSKDGDAKMLEIGGTASSAVIEYVRSLREAALESIRGNRSNADKLSAAQSGRALELLYQPLIWLADSLRATYGENALLSIIRMIMMASRKFSLRTKDGPIPAFSEAEKPTLRWPPWFVPTGHDQAQDAMASSTLLQAGLISRETLVKQKASQHDIENVADELTRIAADMAEADQRAIKLQAQVQAKASLEN